MDSITLEQIEGQSATGPVELRAAATTRERASAYLELTKPRITTLVLLTTAAGFSLGSQGAFQLALFANTVVGVALLCSGVSALNEWMERDLDVLMRRTASRPLPTGRLTSREAFLFGVALTCGGEIYLAALVNPLSALCGLGVVVGYLFLYTPLKTRTSLSTAVGAFPGAVPPLLGWAAATNTLGLEAWALFAILFLWQFPHFFAIAWMYREDYARAGILMLPVVEPDGKLTKQQMVVWTLMLVPVSLAPVALGISGYVYFAGALVLGALFLATCVAAAATLSRRNARRVLLASVLYLPLLFGLMVLKI
ncbi:MAG: heme o synthase [Acidobacteria bacterium]|nr:heme o synthase [Acidobacteriota bacterium]MCA1642049.1 heme o synthase [Acidobacteriota bacterium]